MMQDTAVLLPSFTSIIGMYWVKLGFAVIALTPSPLEIAVGSESAPFRENRKLPDSVAVAVEVRYVFSCLSERSQRLDMVNPVRWRTKVLSCV